jgi:hypothetical protein
MKWCCAGFENRYQLAGERSIAVLVDENGLGEPEFILQARAFDRGEEPSINTAVPMSLVIDAAMQFCPWCGVSLRKWYGKYICELVRPGYKINRGF